MFTFVYTSFTSFLLGSLLLKYWFNAFVTSSLVSRSWCIHFVYSSFSNLTDSTFVVIPSPTGVYTCVYISVLVGKFFNSFLDYPIGDCISRKFPEKPKGYGKVDENHGMVIRVDLRIKSFKQLEGEDYIKIEGYHGFSNTVLDAKDVQRFWVLHSFEKTKTPSVTCTKKV